MKIKYQLGRLLSDSPRKQLICYAVAVGIVVFIAGFIGTCCLHQKGWNVVVAMLSPVKIASGDDNFWRLMAYLIGAIAFSGVLISVITNMIRTAGDRYVNGTAHYRFKDHILFLGYDELMIGTIRKISKEFPKTEIVVAVPKDAESVRNTLHQYLTKEQSQRLYVIKASRVMANDLKRKAYVQTATRVFIVGQPDEEAHDANNLKCLGLVAALCPERMDGQDDNSINEKVCMYYLRNQSTFYLLHRLSYKPEDFEKSIMSERLCYDEKRVKKYVKAAEPFNFHESIARHVLFGEEATGNKKMLRLNAVDRDPHLIVYGMTTMGVALMRDTLMTQHFPNRRLHITMVDENAREEMHYLIGRHRPFFENCHYSFRCIDDPSKDYDHPAQLDFLDVDIDFIQCDVAHPQMTEYLRKCVEADSGGTALAVAICTDESPKNMALALYMPKEILENVSVWVYQKGDSSMNSFVEHGVEDIEEKKNRYKNIHIFSTFEYGIADRRKSLQWVLAKAVGENYAEKHPEEVDQPYSWKYSQTKDRWSSLYGAISKLVMMRAIGKEKTPIILTDSEKEILAIAEHNRWNTEKLLNGWNPATDGEKTLYQHNKIIPYENLDEKTRVKDREQIDAVVRKLNEIKNGKQIKL